MKKPRILIVDDEEDILDLLEYNLKANDFSVIRAIDGVEALKLVPKEKPDMILLDIMMPNLDGIETCRRIREMPGSQNIYIIFLTARAEEYSEVAGFEAGADDYISKPVKPRVLIKRIQAAFRRKREDGESKDSDLRTVIHDLEILKDEYMVYQNGKAITLPKKEFELLSFLASRPGKVLTREVLLENVWGTDVLVVDRTVDVHIRKLREKLGKKYIDTVKGVGYKFLREE